MTWIVATPTIFGYGFAISDVRVTLRDGSVRDCLQKIHPVGRHLVAGFAGSVFLGFAMIKALSSLLHSDDESGVWDPVSVADWWPDYARQIFTRSPESEQALNSHLIMVSTHPTENCGDAPWARAYVHVFKSPDFEPTSIAVSKMGAIGSGTAVDACQQAIDELSNDRERMSSVMKGEVGMPGGMGTVLGFGLTHLLKRIQPSGISAHLHYCWVYRGSIIIKTNDHSIFGAWTAMDGGSGVNQEQSASPSPSEPKGETTGSGIQFRMPQIASTWGELVELLHNIGAKADGCVA